MAGYDNLIFGAGVPGLGSDGIMAGDARLTVKREKKDEMRVKGEKVGSETDDILGAAEPLSPR